MTHEEQKRQVEDLRRFISKMNPRERSEFTMMLKRNKDDEDFDSFTQQKLTTLHAKYLPKKSKEELEKGWNSLTHGH